MKAKQKTPKPFYLFILGFFLLNQPLISQTVNIESFDNATFPPTDWTNLLTSGTNSWVRVTTGSFPVQSPHSGAGEARFNSAFVNNGQRALISPVYDLSYIGSNTATVSFWVFRDNTNPSNADKIDVLINTTATLSGATSLGTVNRPISQLPIESVIGWYQYTFNVPLTFNGPSNYLILNATSAMGNNIFIDDVSWDSYPFVCLGTPTPGNTLSTASSICPGLDFTLSLENTSPGNSETYQWQSSFDNITFTDIIGATSSILTTSQTSNTYYNCIVTCSSNSATSNSIVISTGFCLCTSTPSDPNYSDIGNVQIGTLNNGDPSPSYNNPSSLNGYTSYLNLPATDLSIGEIQTINVSQINFDLNIINSNVNVYIDYNQNGLYEVPSELVYSSTNSTTETNPNLTGNFTIPSTASIGLTTMRVQLYDIFQGTITDPCSELFFYGEVEDYTVNIICPSINPTSLGASVCMNTSAELTVTPNYSGSTISWFTTQIGGSEISTSNPYTTGNISSNTSYWISETLGNCPSSDRVEVLVNIDPINVILTHNDLICNGDNNGTFTLATVNCGTPPFTYSINGGAFGPIPTNLTAGTYSIIVQGAMNELSSTITMTFSEPSPVPLPIGFDASSCINTLSAIISAESIIGYETATLVIPINVLTQPVETGFDPGEIFTTALIPSLPEGSVISGALFSYPNLTPLDQSYAIETMIGFSGIVTQAGQSGINTAFDLNPFDYSINIDPSLLPINGGTINIHYWDQWDENPGAECLFPLGNGVANISITYSKPVYSTITWWTALNGGTQIGTGNQLETIGTSVLPTSANSGTYNFYAQSENGSCVNGNRILVTATITSSTINPTITAQSGIHLTANGIGFPLNYQWYNCATETLLIGETNSTYTASTDGTYFVVISDGFCTQKSACITVNTIGIGELNTLNNQFKIYPNPTSENIQITFKEANNVSIEMYDFQGKLITKLKDVISGDFISLDGVQSGIYMIKVISDSGISSQRIVKK